MNHRLNRRLFLKRAAVATGALSATRFLSGLNLLQAASPGDKLSWVQIGCGGRGMTHLGSVVGQNLVAIVDVNEKRHDFVKKWLKNKNSEPDKVQTFVDYREMFDKIAKQIDAVFIATPNHQHALPAMIAMQLGKAVYCEKPVCHDIAEARAMRALAAKTKVATQMGNQGHGEDGYRRPWEYIWAGVMGEVGKTRG